MMDTPKPKNKGGRPKKPPTPPMLGIAERSGTGFKLTLVLGGLVVNGKKFDPQTGAELLADMLAEWMAKTAPRPAAPAEAAMPPAADSLEWSSQGASPDLASLANPEDLPALEVAMAPGSNGSH